MQIWRTSRPARVYVRESEASQASRILLRLHVLAIESIDTVSTLGFHRVVVCLSATKKKI